MAKKEQPKMVKCRYAKCNKIHDSQELNKNDAVQGGKNSYYHPDCYHILQTVNQIKDLFVKHINSMMTGQQIGILVSTVNNMIFSKHIDVDYILFALQYFLEYKPGKLHQPFGLHYIVQDRDVVSAWEREKQRKLKEEIREQQKKILIEDDVGLDQEQEDMFTYKPQKARSFADILG